MDTLGVTLTDRRFHLDEEAIPETMIHPRCPVDFKYANDGKHIARNKTGLWFCAFITTRNLRDTNYIGLSIASAPQAVGGGMRPTVWLAGGRTKWWTTHFEPNGLIRNVCLLIDAHDTLHVLFSDSDGVWETTADASGGDPWVRLKEAGAWSAPARLGEAGGWLHDAAFLPDGRIAVYFTLGGALFERVGDRVTKVCPDVQRPNVWIAADGTRHIAFERQRRIFYLRSDGNGGWRGAGGAPEPEMVAYFCSSWPSIALTNDGKVVIVYQGEGKVDLKRQPDAYGRLRAGGGSTVSYAVHDGRKWQVRDLLHSKEILLKRMPSSSIGGRGEKFLPFMEEYWRPSLAVDKHGVLWMFFLNTTRRHIFFTRFQGEAFGDYFEARGAYDVLSRVMFVQKLAYGSADIGFMTVAANQVYFDHIEVPEYSSRDRRRVVFLDNLEVEECVGVEHRLGKWRKHPVPLFGKFLTGDGADDDIAWCHVRKVAGGFEMEYMGQGSLRSNALPGRAFSHDGYVWEKRTPFDREKMTLDGQPFPSDFWRPIYLEDPDEKNPDRRFKGLQQAYQVVTGIEIRTWKVVASPDATHWHTVPGLPMVCMGDISCGFHLIRDEEDKDPARRYKVLMLMGSHAGRAGCVFTSPDLLRWDKVNYLREDPENVLSATSPWPTGPIAIDPDAGESPWEEEVHDAVLWRENGLLMCHYDGFYFHGNQHINKALAVSRDGKHYWRIKRGEINMPHGDCGEWDSGRDRTDVPVRVGDELWLYFCGMPAGFFADPDEADYDTLAPGPPSPDDQKVFGELRPWRVGLAKLRVDGWGYVRRDRDAEEGILTTIPFQYEGGQLVVNGSGLDPKDIGIEIRRADNVAAVPGFEADHCRFSATDSVSAQVAWKAGMSLPKGTYRLRFVFRGIEPKLFSFGFEQA